LQIDTEVETDNAKVDFITPIFSGLETESVSETVATTKSIESLKSVTPPSLEEVRKELSVKSDSQSVKEEEFERIYGGSTAGGPHLNGGDLRHEFRLRR
jgi:hypothetical protein